MALTIVKKMVEAFFRSRWHSQIDNQIGRWCNPFSCFADGEGEARAVRSSHQIVNKILGVKPDKQMAPLVSNQRAIRRPNLLCE